RLQAKLLGMGAARQHQRSGAVGNRTGIGRRDTAAFAERRLERRDLLRHGLGRLLVVANGALLAPQSDVDRDDLAGEAAAGNGLAGTLQRGQRVGVLFFAAEAMMLRTVFGKGAHQSALVVGILEAVEK